MQVNKYLLTSDCVEGVDTDKYKTQNKILSQKIIIKPN
ncbi:hypothetical protein NIES3974_39910 [Calothrix sp. NIES-3974]|nr:hypothetical protein NIES3974_39910 [Calothrix sp. NIES-3974]